jgi:hypothetical protein
VIHQVKTQTYTGKPAYSFQSYWGGGVAGRWGSGLNLVRAYRIAGPRHLLRYQASTTLALIFR